MHVVVVTDCSDVAFNEFKLALRKECYSLGVEKIEVELAEVEEFSILNASFVSRLLAEQLRPGSLLSVVINPQKHRSDRIFGTLESGVHFFGANTGALTWTLDDLGIEELYRIEDPGFVSFGGKYVHAPNIAKMVKGEKFGSFGVPFDPVELTPLKIEEGVVLHIDNFGTAKIFGKRLTLEDGGRISVSRNGEIVCEAIYSDRMMNNEDCSWVLYNGSSLWGLPELGRVRNAFGVREIEVKVGDVITWNDA
jgi:S-adenosylmethionine hydrolase